MSSVESSMFSYIKEAGNKYPSLTALEFYNNRITYRELLNEIQWFSKRLVCLSVKEGDRVVICLPNIPQAVIAFYSLNAIGAVPCMVHPLSTAKELEFYIKETKSCLAITLDLFYPQFERMLEEKILEGIIVTRVSDYLDNMNSFLYYLKKGRKIKSIKASKSVDLWYSVNNINSFLAINSENEFSGYSFKSDEVGLILFSGGTTGIPKGVMVSNNNMNSLAEQVLMQVDPRPGEDSMLCIMPLFHGFGLGVCMHPVLSGGGKCILVPRFDKREFAKAVLRSRPTYMAGVPTLYNGLISNRGLKNKDLSFIKGMFCGGDKYPEQSWDKIKGFMKEHGITCGIREGYGLTECLTACTIMPSNDYKKGSVGKAFPEISIKIIDPLTGEDQPAMEEGEICVSGPTLMMGYLNNEKETLEALKIHSDDRLWLHTGDLGYMDNEGFLYFKQRIKRLIKCSGYCVYPSQVEDAINSHPAVELSCVIGKPDSYSIERVVAYIVLKNPTDEGEAMKNSILEHVSKQLNKISVPSQWEFKSELPLTRMGKVAYQKL